jgi:hypothetical protein
MNRLLRLSIFGATALAASSAMAGVTFFEGENYAGRQITADRALENFPSVGFNDRARSAVIEGNAWQVCMDINFGGGCTVLAPGRYPNLGDWSGRISSTRPVGGPMAAAPAAPVGGAVTFFGNRNYGGRQFTINQPLPNLAGTRANDRAESAIVEGGAWEVCSDAEFRGDCQVFQPGRYPTLGSLDGRVTSARPYYERRGERPRDGVRGRATATLFSEPNLTGRPFPLGGEGDANLYGQFNDRASSLRVESGYWIFCSDAGFRGECRTFGPGDYARLPPELENRISSGRRITNEYPYTQASGRR